MATTAPKPIVVGVNGLENALDAVAYAACEADIRAVPLRIVHAFVWPLLKVPPVLWQMGPEGGLQSHVEQILATAEKTAHAAAPGVQVTTAVSTDFPLPLLVQESRNATFVVVGSPGLGALADAITGSDSVQLIARSHAPVMIVPATPPPDRTSDLVVVGVDESACAAAAVAVAMEEAALRHGRLLAVHVDPTRRRLSSRFGRVPGQGGLRILDRTLPELRRTYPDVPIEERIIFGHPGGALVDLSSRAAVVVVGSRGRGGFAGMMLGSVSQALLHHADSPVIVVPAQRGQPTEASEPAHASESTPPRPAGEEGGSA
ncbi:MAG TPA: universal stress protein [Actinopolymorphaceae bacterium]|nr:universal stress protein [Actinopolymorphaceae bacterium]